MFIAFMQTVRSSLSSMAKSKYLYWVIVLAHTVCIIFLLSDFSPVKWPNFGTLIRRHAFESSASPPLDAHHQKENEMLVDRKIRIKGLNLSNEDHAGSGSPCKDELSVTASSDEQNQEVQGIQCDVFAGKWVRDDSYSYYSAGSCPFIDESFDCFNNKRPDHGYQKWRWQPHGCNIPRLNSSHMLERLKNKRLSFVGDSLNRNMWESLVCILRQGLKDKMRVWEISGKRNYKTEGFYAFKFEDYNCTIEFIRAPFLVQEWKMPSENVSSMTQTLRLDSMDSYAARYRDSDVLVFNTGHWWTHEKATKGLKFYQEGDYVYPHMDVLEAFQRALKTWADWIDLNIDSQKTQVYFKGYSASHFRGGPWNSGGQCHNESEPILDDKHVSSYPKLLKILEEVMKQMKTPVTYLNITKMSAYRKDAHPSIYRENKSKPQLQSNQDCSHWCLPGVPDTWNALLYASMLKK